MYLKCECKKDMFENPCIIQKHALEKLAMTLVQYTLGGTLICFCAINICVLQKSENNLSGCDFSCHVLIICYICRMWLQMEVNTLKKTHHSSFKLQNGCFYHFLKNTVQYLTALLMRTLTLNLLSRKTKAVKCKGSYRLWLHPSEGIYCGLGIRRTPIFIKSESCMLKEW